MRGRCRESEPVEAPPHRAELGFSFLPCCPLPAGGYRMHTFDSLRRLPCKRDSSHFNEIAETLASTFFTEGAPANPLDLSRFSRCVNPITACGERATHAERKPNLGSVRGRFHKLRLAERPPHPDLLPASGEKETAVRLGCPKQTSESAQTNGRLEVHA